MDGNPDDSGDSDATEELNAGPNTVTRFADTMDTVADDDNKSIPDSQDDVPDTLDPSDPEYFTEPCPRCDTGTRSTYTGNTLGAEDCIECYLRRRGNQQEESPQGTPRPAPPSPAKSNCRYPDCPGFCEETDAQDEGLTCPVCNRHQLVDDEPQEDIDTQPVED